MFLAPLPTQRNERGLLLKHKKMTTVNNIKNTGKLTALISFVIGTFFLLFFVIFKTYDSIVIIGMYYIAIAFIVNSIVFLSVFISGLYFWDRRLELFATCGILLLNIPIAIGYFFLVLNLSSL